MTTKYSELAKQLRAAIEDSKHTIDQLADRTKVPRTTILALVEEPIAAVLPERVYLRGHLKVLWLQYLSPASNKSSNGSKKSKPGWVRPQRVMRSS
ncbi:MAG: helix-turn-helix domain-containing protein, partial [Myxococcota bacterium]